MFPSGRRRSSAIWWPRRSSLRRCGSSCPARWRASTAAPSGKGCVRRMYKIAVLGDRDSVLGFRALGLDTFFVEDTEEARHTLHRLARENYAIIYMTEALAEPLAA